MVAAQDEEVFRVLDLVREQKANSLQGLLATINVVTEEQVVGFWGETAVLKKSQQVIVLPVYIAANLS